MIFERSAQPKAQAGGTREACRVVGEVGVLNSSVDLWESRTHGEPREGTCPNAQKRSEGRGDGPRGLPTPNKVRKLQITLYRSPSPMSSGDKHSPFDSEPINSCFAIASPHPIGIVTIMGDSNPKNTQKKKAQQSAKKVSGQKKPVAPSVPASGKRK